MTPNSFDAELDKTIDRLVSTHEILNLTPEARQVLKSLYLTHHNAEYKKLVTKRAAHYTEDGLVADALDPWAVPVSAIEDLIKEPTNGE